MHTEIFRHLFEQTGVGQAIVGIDENIILVNSSLCSFLGYEKDELEGKSVKEISYLDDYMCEQQYKADILNLKLTSYKMNKRFYHKNGTLVWGMLHVSFVTLGEDSYYIVQLSDITKEMKEKLEIVNKYEILKLLTKYSANLLTLHQPDGTVLFSSSAIKTLLGYSESEYEGQNPFDFIHPEDVYLTLKNLEDILITGQIREIYYRMRKKDGSYVWLETITNVIKDSNTNKVVELIANSRDVTDKVEAKLELEKVNKQLNEIINGINEAFISIDQNFCINYLNDFASKLLGIDKEIANGQPLGRLIPAFENSTIYKKSKEVLQSKSKVTFTIEIENNWYEIKLVPSGDGLLLYSSDITKHVLLLNQLSESEVRYRMLVERSPDGIVVHDQNKIYFVNKNAAKIYGFTYPTELFGRDFFDFAFAGTNKEKILEKEKFPRFLESRIVQPSGKVIDVELSDFRILYNGKPMIQSVIRDITEKKKLNSLLQKSEKLAMVGELAAAVAHEIRNPLTTIKGFIQIFSSTKEYNADYMEVIENELKSVESVIFEFLSLAKPNSEVIFKNSNIHNIIYQVLSLLKSQAILEKKQITYHQAEEIQLECEPNLIKQVLINIIQNGLNAIEKHGKVTIDVRKINDSHVLIKIKDNGCGISKSMLEKLGEPFYSTKEKGTGLGVMTSMKIVQNHGGNILFESKEGNGTTVNIYLPISPKTQFNKNLISKKL